MLDQHVTLCGVQRFGGKCDMDGSVDYLGGYCNMWEGNVACQKEVYHVEGNCNILEGVVTWRRKYNMSRKVQHVTGKCIELKGMSNILREVHPVTSVTISHLEGFFMASLVSSIVFPSMLISAPAPGDRNSLHQSFFIQSTFSLQHHSTFVCQSTASTIHTLRILGLNRDINRIHNVLMWSTIVNIVNYRSNLEIVNRTYTYEETNHRQGQSQEIII